MTKISPMVKELVESLLNHASAVIAGDGAQQDHVATCRADLEKGLGADGITALAEGIAAGDLLATMTALTRGLMAAGEPDAKAVTFAAGVVSQHRLPEHLT